MPSSGRRQLDSRKSISLRWRRQASGSGRGRIGAPGTSCPSPRRRHRAGAARPRRYRRAPAASPRSRAASGARSRRSRRSPPMPYEDLEPRGSPAMARRSQVAPGRGSSCNRRAAARRASGRVAQPAVAVVPVAHAAQAFKQGQPPARRCQARNQTATGHEKYSNHASLDTFERARSANYGIALRHNCADLSEHCTWKNKQECHRHKT